MTVASGQNISCTITNTFVGGGSCLPPSSGDWIITSSCTLTSSATAPGNVKVQNNSVLTIPADLTLEINFVQFTLIIEFGSGELIEANGALKSAQGRQP